MVYTQHSSLLDRTFPGLVLFAVILIVVACNNKKPSDQYASDVKNADSVREEVLKGLSGDGISKQLHAMGSPFQREALNDISRVSHYLQLSNRGGAAANLGVYMSDLGYLAG